MPNKRWILPTVGWLLGLCAFDGLGASDAGSQTKAHYHIDIRPIKDGLPQNSVIAMTRTRDGYLWLGTLGGLVRFDGVHAAVFDENNTPGLGSSRIVFLFEDSHGNLWVGTETAGVVLVKDGQVTSLGIGKGSREKRLLSACEDQMGVVWLYAANGQLWRYQEEHFKTNGVEPGLGSDCRVVISEPSGPVWVGTDTNQSAFDPKAAFRQTDLPPGHDFPAARKLDFLLASQHGGYWRLADGQIQKCRTNRVEHNFGSYPWGGRTIVSAACEDREGNLVVGTMGEGVYWFDANGNATRISGKDGLSHDTILSLCVDRSGSLWVGTDGGGVNRVKRQVFDVLEASQGVLVKSVCEDSQGGLWFGGGGLWYWRDGVAGMLAPVQGLENRYVSAVFADRNDRVWVGFIGAGLFYFQSGSLHAPEPEVLRRDIPAIYQDRTGRLWVGTEGGLACYETNRWKVFTTRDGLSSDVVRAIAQDAQGDLWIGTGGGGLNRLQNGQFTSFRTRDGLPSDNVSSLMVDSTGVLWVGTGGGLARFRAGKWTGYTTREGLIANSIGYLIEDGQGFLWIGSNLGLMRVSKKALNDFAEGLVTSIPCHVYGEPDGLPAAECSSGSQPGAGRSRDGRLWFPTIKGLATLDPARITLNTNRPAVLIESVTIDGREQTPNRLRAPPPKSVTIPAGKEHLEIRYTCLNLEAPDQVRFNYQMEGYERVPIDAGNNRVAGYSKLPPGHYHFQVTARNQDGVWSEPNSDLAIVVEPPFWRTWWFLGAVVVSLLGTIVAVVHFLSTQKLQRQLEQFRQQEALEKERARIARDIHDQLGASLTRVSLLGELVESDKNSPDEIEAHARQISQTARDTTRDLDEIVWTVNPSNDTLDGLITYVCKYAQDYLAVAGLRYRLEVPAQLPDTPIPPEVRHNVFLAAKEAVTNVVRHAKASEVRLRLKSEPTRFVLEIEDNGRGIGGLDETAAQTRNGLRNMRKRMEDIGGSFTIGPGADGGARVRLIAPIGKS